MRDGAPAKTNHSVPRIGYLPRNNRSVGRKLGQASILFSDENTVEVGADASDESNSFLECEGGKTGDLGVLQ
jgi:hypothetical protein